MPEVPNALPLRSLTAIGFLILLVYHLIGLPLAVLTFEESYEAATPIVPEDQWRLVKLPISLPYTNDWENPTGQEGLVEEAGNFYNIVQQRYANDTLYTLLKTNQNAKERFVDLAEQLQVFQDEQDTPKTPLNRLLKLLKDRLTIYLPTGTNKLVSPVAVSGLSCLSFGDLRLATYQIDLDHHSPPPEK